MKISNICNRGDCVYSKSEIFRDIVNIMNNDYAGFSEKKNLNNPDNYEITDAMDNDLFVKTVESYLLDFKDGHLLFKMKNNKVPFNGFKVRRFENALYVTELQGEKRLQIGDEIVALDGLSIEQYEKLNHKILANSVHERQNWNAALRDVHTIKVQRDSQLIEFDLKEYERTSYIPEYSFKEINPHTVYMKITDFLQAEPIQKLITDNENVLNEVENLIIDVRVNLGGNDMFYLPLADYIFHEKTATTDIFEEDEVMYTNYTENNCKLWIATLKEYLEQPLDPDTKGWIEEEIKKYSYNSGKGLLLDNDETVFIINGKPNPKNIYILSDVFCGSAGDTFVKNAKKSPKVTVVGRATMGIIDYFNVATKDYGEYEFIYSISKMNEKYHCSETGVLPHIHIPWTPKHLKEDVDLNYVLNLCGVPSN